ncbi:MAG TPA: TetR family transcriptional regulator [Aquihabitans sp.]|jgi:AcrR family transcriptional regulator|nr:TetR family transcriptional regulator [Aquihabitans sp.]
MTAAQADEGDATTARILDAAHEQLLDVGLRRSSVEDIARRAGIARITVYRRFGGRDDLIRAVLLREGRRLLEAVDLAVAGIDDPDEQLVEGFTAILAATRSHPLLHRLLELESDTTVASMTTHGGPVVALGREHLVGHLLRSGRGGLDEGDARVIAEILVRLTLSFVLTPDSVVALDTDHHARAFARRFLLPAVRTAAPA